MKTKRRKLTEAQTAARFDRVAAGKCGSCGRQRNKFEWLCDVCAAEHRRKQRNDYDPTAGLAEDD
jgi:hypothetical protein